MAICNAPTATRAVRAAATVRSRCTTASGRSSVAHICVALTLDGPFHIPVDRLLKCGRPVPRAPRTLARRSHLTDRQGYGGRARGTCRMGGRLSRAMTTTGTATVRAPEFPELLARVRARDEHAFACIWRHY